MSKAIRAALLAGAAAISVGAIGTPARALIVVHQGPPEFELIESPGQYTLVNNSDQYAEQWYVYGFTVTNPAADYSSARTTQTNWSSCGGSCTGNAFYYYNNDLGSVASADLANDIGPGQRSSKFFFSAPEASSPTFDVVNSSGQTATFNAAIPEPATWAMLLIGFSGLGLAGYAAGGRGRRRARAAPPL